MKKKNYTCINRSLLSSHGKLKGSYYTHFCLETNICTFNIFECYYALFFKRTHFQALKSLFSPLYLNSDSLARRNKKRQGSQHCPQRFWKVLAFKQWHVSDISCYLHVSRQISNPVFRIHNPKHSHIIQ